MNSKCQNDECVALVCGVIDHSHCAIHRPCNCNALYNPEACESRMVPWTNIKDNTGLAQELHVKYLKICLDR